MKMIVLLLTLCLLALATAGLAGEPPKQYYCGLDTIPPGLCNTSFRLTDASKDPCLAHMEEAMRAMEPFIINHDTTYQPRVLFEGWSKEVVKEYDTANRLWEDVMRQCWKEKP